MVRTIITPKEKKISISIPNDFIGKKVEVIAFTIEEGNTTKLVSKNTFQGLSINTSDFKFNREEANER